MKDYKLIRVLSSFSEKDLNKLKLFVHSPYFNVKEEIKDFLRLIMENLSHPETSFQEIWNQTIHVNFSEERLRKKLHECLVVIEKFLATESFFNSPLKTSKSTLDGVIEKNIDDLITKSLKNVECELDEFEQLTFEYYSKRFELYNAYYNLVGFDRKIAIKKNRDTSEFLQKADRILNEIYMSEKLRLAHLLNHDNYNANRNDKLTFIDQVLGIAKRTTRNGSKPHFYVQLYELDQSDHIPEDIGKLHDYISRRSQLFEKVEFSSIIFTLLNEAIRVLNQGNKRINQTIFDLYRTGLKNDSFLFKGELLPDTFRNIATSACRLKKFDWALDFVEEYENMLNPKYRDTAVAFNRARIYWYQNNFEKVIEQLRDVEFDDLFYNRTTKLMMMTSYYQLDEIDALDSLIKSFNVYLRRKTNLSQSVKSSFKNFNSILQDIVRAKERRDKIKLKNIRKRLESKMIAPNKSWLMEKVEELEKQFGVARELESHAPMVASK